MNDNDKINEAARASVAGWMPELLIASDAAQRLQRAWGVKLGKASEIIAQEKRKRGI